MEDTDIQSPNHGATSRPVATPSRPGQRGHTGNQGKTSNVTPTLRVKGDAHARPPSAALSGWEDDSPQRGSDLLEYLGKADSVDSGTSTPPQTATVTGDLTQALLIARMAADVSAGGDSGLGRKSSLKSQSSGDSYAGRIESKSRLAQGSGSPAPDASQSHGAGGQHPTLPPLLAANAENAEEQQQLLSTASRTGDEMPLEGSGQAPWSGVNSGGDRDGDGAGVGASTEAERLRCLLYSDDEGDDDDDYQDLMTADDDALFAGVDQSSNKNAGKNGRSGGGRSNRSLALAGRSSPSGASDVSRRGVPGAALVGAPSSGNSSVVTTASGDAGQSAGYDLAVRCSKDDGAAVAAAAVALTTTVSASSVAGLAASMQSMSPRKRDVEGVDQGGGGETASNRDLIPSSPQRPEVCTSPVLSAEAVKGHDALGPQGSGFRGGPATEALEHVLSGRSIGSTILGLGPLVSSVPAVGALSPAAPQSASQDAAKLEPPVLAPQGQGQGSVQGLSSNHFGQQHHHPQHHYVSIPTPQIGEGLRQHPPQSRRLYTPGQSSRSPIRGSGFMVSPPAVRSTSPSTSPGRGLHSAVHHHPPSHHQQSVARRLSSPSVSLCVPNSHRTRSPRESHASTAITVGSTLAPDNEELAPGGTLGGIGLVGGAAASAAVASGGPLLNGGVLKMGSWVTGTASTVSAAAAAAGGGGGGNNSSGQSLALSHSTISRFPPAHVQTFPGGQVYRSTPISQVPGSSSEERIDAVGAGGGVGTGTAPSGNTLGPGAVRSAGSPGRMSARTGRQPRVPGASSSGGPSGTSGTASGYTQDRFGGSYSAPARPSTSPHKPRSGGGTRSSGLVSIGALSATASTALHSNGALAETADTSSAFVAAAIAAVMPPPPPRGIAVPVLPTYPTALGIRHCGFKQAPAPGSGSGMAGSMLYGGLGAATTAAAASGGGSFGPPYTTTKQKAATAPDERMRSHTLSKIFAGVGVAPGLNVTPQDYPQFHGQHGQSSSPRGNGDTFGSGPNFPVADGAAISPSGPTEPFPSHPQLHPHPSSQQQLQLQQMQTQRKGSLPHLQAPMEPQVPSGLLAHNHHQGAPGLYAPGPSLSLALYGRSSVSRNSGMLDQGLPAVQAPQFASGARSLSFDASRRATPRA
ncbi:hypothetical protein Vretimale_7846 [Volvox reticuliferus]|uniref:Uncharacterized protein n=1 Tax=Volvox reticuliferus TaxID=1737510 RepID=A0A8J4LN67_9CHLO|nr:hypothetical protein Vretifemale_4993 [Volvox reticuliferus]GIM03035.1 hypothetical protein Vretimale_7846 [Volvox reticuliferus]